MSSDEALRSALWGENSAPLDVEVVFQQYQLYVEMADRISSRRNTANNFFLGINGALLATGAPLLNKFLDTTDDWMIIFPFFIVSLLLFFWWRLIFSYKQLNGAKFRIIGFIEEKLPAKIYGKTEWNLLLEKGENRSAYWPLTHLELKVPIVFFIGYILLFAGVLLT